jgi:hypothetical protein
MGGEDYKRAIKKLLDHLQDEALLRRIYLMILAMMGG